MVELIEILQKRDSHESQLGQRSTVCHTLHPSLGLRQNLHRGDDRLQSPTARLFLQLATLIGSDAEQRRFSGTARRNHQIAEVANQLIGERFQLHALAQRRVEQLQRGRAVSRDEGFD